MIDLHNCQCSLRQSLQQLNTQQQQIAEAILNIPCDENLEIILKNYLENDILKPTKTQDKTLRFYGYSSNEADDLFIQLIEMANSNPALKILLERDSLKPLWQKYLNGNYKIRRYYIAKRIVADNPYEQLAAAYINRHINQIRTIIDSFHCGFSLFQSAKYQQCMDELGNFENVQQYRDKLVQLLAYLNFKNNNSTESNRLIQSDLGHTQLNCTQFFKRLFIQYGNEDIPENSPHFSVAIDNIFFIQFSQLVTIFEQKLQHYMELSADLNDLYGIEMQMHYHNKEMIQQLGNIDTDRTAQINKAERLLAQLTNQFERWGSPAYVLYAHYSYRLATFCYFQHQAINNTISPGFYCDRLKQQASQTRSQFIHWFEVALEYIYRTSYCYIAEGNEANIYNANANRNHGNPIDTPEQKLLTASIVSRELNHSIDDSINQFAERVHNQERRRAIEQSAYLTAQQIMAPA